MRMSKTGVVFQTSPTRQRGIRRSGIRENSETPLLRRNSHEFRYQIPRWRVGLDSELTPGASLSLIKSTDTEQLIEAFVATEIKPDRDPMPPLDRPLPQAERVAEPLRAGAGPHSA